MSALAEYVDTNRERFLAGLVELLRIPSISAGTEHTADVRRCADWLADHMRGLGLRNVQILETGGHPAIYADWLDAPGAPTVLVYGHYDVQPVDPLNEWETPPFEPTVRNGQIFARGSADDKGQVFMHLKAVEAHLQTAGRLPLNLKFIVEGEEEIGSEHLDPFMQRYKDMLRADLVVVSDTGWFANDVPSITYGLRGIGFLQVDLQGPSTDVHSGQHGGAAGNPIQALVQILAALKDESDHVTVSGFYDAVRAITPQEQNAWDELPFDEPAYAKSLGVPELHGERGFSVLERLWARPTLEVNGIWGGFSGEGSKTIIPARASAKLSFRLVPDQVPEQVVELVEAELRRLCPSWVTMKITRMGVGKPTVTDLEHPAVQAALRALERSFGKRAVFIRAGGSIPIVASFQDVLKLPAVLLGMANSDEHAHAPNERFSLDNFYGGIKTAAYMWEELATASDNSAEND
jgi:acetylornithine deacetylase/succinyl-diaminopimelate desuccinylase-like protein